MSQGAYVTLVGFVAQDPKVRTLRSGTRVTDLRVGTTPRILDRVTGEWRDAQTSYFDVACWRRLGDHVRASLRKGDPVMIKGKFRTSGYTDKNGVYRISIKVEADTVGHDLTRGIANFMRPESRSAATEDERDLEPVPDFPEDDEMTEDDEMLEDRDRSADRDMIDAEAVEQFGHALDSLGEAGLADQALDEDEAADATVPSVSPTSY